MFVRTIPIIVDCKDKTIKNYLADVSNLILESMTNNIYPFRLIAKEFDLNNDVTFEYNMDLNDVSESGDNIVFSDMANSVSEVLCVVNNLDDGFVVHLNHLSKISQDTALRFVKVFREVLLQFLDKEKLSDINYICEDDVKLLNSYNNTGHFRVL